MRPRDMGLATLINVLWGVNFAVIDLGLAQLRERPHPRQVVGLAVAAGGIAVVATGASSAGTHTLRAFALVLAAGVAWGVANVSMRRAAPGDMLKFMVWVSAL